MQIGSTRNVLLMHSNIEHRNPPHPTEHGRKRAGAMPHTSRCLSHWWEEQ